MKSKNNTNKALMDLDRVTYEIETDELLHIGDSVTYEEKILYVKEVSIKIKKSQVQNVYKLSTKKGCTVDTIYNEKITGLSVQGKVIETSKDELKLHLCIDQEQDPGKAWFFKYTTSYTAEGQSGWYCMPELGDTVYAYFPDKEEGNAVALVCAGSFLSHVLSLPHSLRD